MSKPKPITWIQTSANSYAASFGPWRVDVTELPSLVSAAAPNYSCAITPLDEKLKDVHTADEAKAIAVRFLALALKAGMESLIEHGVIGVKSKA